MRITFIYICTLLMLTPLWAQDVERLRSAILINEMDVLKDLDLLKEKRLRRLISLNPYRVSTLVSDHQEVCALKFVDKQKKYYVLKTFNSVDLAIEHEYHITHYNHCGTCSSLRDLHIYMTKPDLTTVGRKCSKGLTAKRIKDCYQERAGFTPLCAESWAYNSLNTRKSCLKTCIKDYGGIIPAIRGTPSTQVDNLGNGQMRPCVECDEVKSGDGFKYAAGRTRRNSGLKSSIIRPEEQIFEVDHSVYFK